MTRNILLLCILLLTACQKELPTLPTHAVDVSWRYEEAAPEFRLVDSFGKVRTLSEFHGKVVVLFFGYIHCPDVCPTTLADWAQVMRLLGKDAERVQVLFVSIDPERDTPELLGKFVPAFNPAFIGLSGDAAATAQAAKMFAVNYEKHTHEHGYTVDHSDGAYLIGTNGKRVLLSPYGQRSELLLEDVRLLLQEKL